MPAIACTLYLLPCTERALGLELTVDEIVKRANRVAYYQAKNGKANVSMTIIDSQARERSRQFTILRWDQPSEGDGSDDTFCGDQKLYIYFHRPADVNKMVFLVWKHADKDDDRWLYMPSIDLVKRIAATDKRTSFVGSDYCYEDVSGRSIDDDTHELVEASDKYYVLKNVPKDPASVEFTHYVMHVHRETFVTVSVEFFHKKNEKYKEYAALKFEEVQDRPTITKASMKDLRSGSETVVEYKDVQYDIDLPEDIFSERYLRRAPQKYLR